MIIFLYGSDAYRLKQAREDIIKEYSRKHSSGVNLLYLDFRENNDAAKLADFFRSSSFFSEHKLAVLSGVFAKKSNSEEIENLIKEYNLREIPDVTFIFSEEGTGRELGLKNKTLFKALSTVSIVKSFEPLEGSALSGWIKKEVSARGCTITDRAISDLVKLVGNESWPLFNEICKLTAFKKEGNITPADVEIMTPAKEDLNIFDLIDALSERNIKRYTELLFKELKTGRDPYYVLTMITYQFRNLLMVKDLSGGGYSEQEIVKKTKLHPFVAKKSLRSPFSTEDAVRIFKDLLTLDSGFKAGKISLEDGLYKLGIKEISR